MLYSLKRHNLLTTGYSNKERSIGYNISSPFRKERRKDGLLVELKKLIVMTKKAIVTFVKNDFGFSETEDGLIVFFHFSNEMKVKFDKGQPFLSSLNKQWPQSKTVKGSVILVDIINGKKGLKAERWGMSPTQSFSNNPPQLSNTIPYRLLKHTRFVGNKECEPEVVWEGTDLLDLAVSHPKNYRLEFFSCDDFDSWTSMQKFENDQWVKTDDIR
jgi:hypothetical protein